MHRCYLTPLNIDRKQLLWMAGFFDGEGCVGRYWQKLKKVQKGGCFLNVLAVVNTERELLEPFLVFGGGISRRHKAEKEHPNHSIAYMYQLRGRLIVVRAVLYLLPYLKSKKKIDQVNIMLSDPFNFLNPHDKEMYDKLVVEVNPNDT